MIVFGIVAIFVSVGGCTDKNGAIRALTEQGYTNIQITGYSWFSCGQDDAFSTGFTATSQNGSQIEGAVCSGWLKGYTIRTF